MSIGAAAYGCARHLITTVASVGAGSLSGALLYKEKVKFTLLNFSFAGHDVNKQAPVKNPSGPLLYAYRTAVDQILDTTFFAAVTVTAANIVIATASFLMARSLGQWLLPLQGQTIGWAAARAFGQIAIELGIGGAITAGVYRIGMKMFSALDVGPDSVYVVPNKKA